MKARIEANGSKGWVTYIPAEQRVEVEHSDPDVRARILRHYEEVREELEPREVAEGATDALVPVRRNGLASGDLFRGRTMELRVHTGVRVHFQASVLE